MSIARRIGDHRPRAILAVLVTVSLASLASGTRGGTVGGAVRTTVGVVSMPVLVVFDRVEAGYGYVAGLFFNYNDMRAETQAMQLDIARLQRRVAESDEARKENTRLRGMLSFQRRHSEFTLVPAEVYQHSGGVLTINLGSLHGIRESMCVLTPDGVIGLITHVGPLTASVATLQSADCKIDTMIKWSRVRGRVYGSGNEMSGLCTMHYIDLKDQVREGDEVVTSPDSIFPSGYPVGKIVGNPQRGDLSQSAYVEPAADPFRVDEVFVLFSATNNWTELSGYQNADSASIDSDLLETRTIQEHLAP